MAVEFLLDKWASAINQVILGATLEKGGTRKTALTIGGQSTLPFMFKEGAIPHRPVIAMEIQDVAPNDWPDAVIEPIKDVINNPVDWAVKCVKKFNADLISLKLQGAHPDSKNFSADQEAKLIKTILKAVDVPLIILGCGDHEKDNLVLPVCCEASKGEACLIGSAVQDNYKTLVASCLADGHSIVAESPIDINIAKQLNILITDMGLPTNRIVSDPTIGALGYGLEYGYSIMERGRLAALSGDKMLSMPFLCKVGSEAWRSKEAKATIQEHPEWGEEVRRGILWETVTATALLQAGADILIMRHPEAVKEIKSVINELMSNEVKTYGTK